MKEIKIPAEGAPCLRYISKQNKGACLDLLKWPWLPTRHLEMSDSAHRFKAQAT